MNLKSVEDYRVYCPACKAFRFFEIDNPIEEELEIHGIHFTCLQQHAHCLKCGGEVYPEEVTNYTVRKAHYAYCEAAGKEPVQCFIYRDLLLDEIEKLPVRIQTPQDSLVSLDDVFRLVDSTPRINASANRYGDWLAVHNGIFKCSECSAEVTKRYKYCPFCASLNGDDGVVCTAFHIENDEPVCLGTKEKDRCSCGGFKDRCTFYPDSIRS